jgi:DNA processing protein
MSPDPLLKYKIGISLIPGIGNINAKKLVAYTGSVEAVFTEKKKALLKIPGIGEHLAEQIVNQQVLASAEKEIAFIEKYRIGYFFYLDENYPVRLKNCEDSPVIFFYKGETDFNKAKMLSIVGTRNITDYGKDCCAELIKSIQLRQHDVTIVSGLAYGVDINAHRAALKNGLHTVAVLAHGLNTLYPSLHKSTAKEICDQGALLTDFTSDIMPERNTFVRRNRIIAGLSDATVVVESGIKGGALITADFANSYNRDVFAFPGRNSDSYSKGCNWLIKSNKAALIESVEDIEYMLGWEMGQKALPKQTELFVQLTDEEQMIADVLRESNELPIDIIAIRVDMPVSKVSACLLNLEFAGLIHSLPGKIYRLKNANR